MTWVFYVSISKLALDKTVEHAKSGGQEEVVGVLIGRVVGQTIVVEDAITGRIESTATRAILPPETIAKIADDIIKQRVQGNIVGWYHSHPGYGIFMSNVDVATQTKLQQFSRYVTALIVDPSSDEVGFFTLDVSGNPMAISPRRVYIFQEGEEPVPPEFEAPIEEPLVVPAIEEVIPQITISKARRTTRYVIVVLLLVGIMLGGTLGAMFLLPDRTPPSIRHTTPTPGGWYGKQLILNATIEVPSKSLIPARVAKASLHYKLASETAFLHRLDPVSLSGNVYNWTIAGAEVKGDIYYYFSALTTAGVNITEPSTPSFYTVRVADFSLKVTPEEWQVFVGKSYKFSVTITPLNHFQSPRVSLSVRALSGVFVFKWASGLNIEELSISTGKPADASLVVEPEAGSYGIHSLDLTAESGSITHSFKFKVVVPSFEIISVEPSTILSVSRAMARTATVIVAFRSLWGDIGVVTWSPLTLKGSTKPELPYGVLPDRNVSDVYLGKDEVKYVAFSFTVSPDTPIGSYEIVLSAYAASCPICRKELILTLQVA